MVTNSTIVLQALEHKSNIETILLGRQGPRGVAFPGRAHRGGDGATVQVHKGFHGDGGHQPPEGFTQSNIDEVPVKKTGRGERREVIVLADSSKINRDVLVLFLGLGQVHRVVTDSGISPGAPGGAGRTRHPCAGDRVAQTGLETCGQEASVSFVPMHTLVNRAFKAGYAGPGVLHMERGNHRHRPLRR